MNLPLISVIWEVRHEPCGFVTVFCMITSRTCLRWFPPRAEPFPSERIPALYDSRHYQGIYRHAVREAYCFYTNLDSTIRTRLKGRLQGFTPGILLKQISHYRLSCTLELYKTHPLR